MHSYIVPPMDRTLGALSKILGKAEAHCTAKNIKPEALLAFRLYPDMFPLTRQVQLACDFAARAAARLAGADIRNFPDTETTFAELQTRITTALDHMASFAAASYQGAESRTITMKQPSGDRVMSGADYLAHMSQPQFFFHVTAAYCILRSKGVDIGKGDYMGA